MSTPQPKPEAVEITVQPAANKADSEQPLPSKGEPSLQRLDRSVDFSFEDVSYSVPGGAAGEPDKKILDSVSGYAEGGELVGILGPSGAGKSTLLDFLAGRLADKPGVTLDGTVRLNGRARVERTFRHMSAYVPQDDESLMGTMTVRESLRFSAELSLPESTPAAEKEARVREVMSELGLDAAADVPVGNIFTKGLSGGQRRRLSMGVELVELPDVLFLDEPTSGLDSAAAHRTIESCQRIARSGRVVFATIHQPSSDVFHMLDKVMLLSRGRPVYFGPVDKVVEHFAHSGFPCPQYSNPADYVMDVINSDFETSTRTKEQAEREVRELVDAYAAHETAAAVRRKIAASVERAAADGGAAPDAGADADAGAADGDDADAGGYRVSQLKQFRTIAARGLLDVQRNPGVVLIRAVMYGLLGLMIGSLFWGVGSGGRDQLDTTDTLSLLFFVAAFETFMSIAVLPFFLQERAVFTRERANGWYSPASYTVAQALVNVPGVLLIALTSTVLIFFMAGLNGSFWIFLLDLFLVLYVAESLVMLVAAIVPVYILGMAVMAGFFGACMLVQGFFRLPSQLPDYWSWLSYITPHYWSFRVFVYNEFHDTGITCPNDSGLGCAFADGNHVLRLYEMDDVDVAAELGILLVMAVVYRAVYWAVLQKFHTGKR